MTPTEAVQGLMAESGTYNHRTLNERIEKAYRAGLAHRDTK